MEKKKIVISFDFNIQYRNLVGSGLLDYLSSGFSSILLLSNNDIFLECPNLPANVSVKSIGKFRFRKLRQLLFFAARYQNAINTNDNAIHRKKWMAGYSTMKFVGITRKLFGDKSKNILMKLCQMDFILNKRRWVEFDDYDLYLSSTYIWQYYDAMVGLYFQKIGKPWVAHVTSWDNPSSKGEFVFNPDKLIVWGEQNYEESIKYLRLPFDRLIKIAPPHFAILKTVKGIEIIENESKYIYYIGVTKNNYTWEAELVRQLLNWISSKPELKGLKVLFRPHPNDRNNWWSDLLKNENLILDDEVDISKIFVYSTDEKNLFKFYKKIKNSVCVISYQSTVCLEAGLLNVPVLMPMFKPGDPNEKNMPHDGWPHMQHMIKNMPQEYLSRSESEMLNMIIGCYNGRIEKEIRNQFYQTCSHIANIESNIFEKYVSEINKILEC
ncbi:MAG: hypothetical protein KJ971_05640 [Firmicutes bacterium]|nr:hypothetical protein [Bacillota bacterium]